MTNVTLRNISHLNAEKQNNQQNKKDTWSMALTFLCKPISLSGSLGLVSISISQLVLHNILTMRQHEKDDVKIRLLDVFSSRTCRKQKICGTLNVLSDNFFFLDSLTYSFFSAKVSYISRYYCGSIVRMRSF